MKRCQLLILGLSVVMLGVPGAALTQESGPVAIALHSEVVVDDSLVTLAQIAKLSGGTETARRRLGYLDITEFKLGCAHMTVLSEQVRFRLLLAGMTETQFRLSGAQRTIIMESDEPATLRKVLAAAQQGLLAEYPGDPAQLTLIPGKGVNVPSVELRKGERLRFEASAKTPIPRAGTARMEVALVVSGKAREVVPVTFEIAAPQISPTSVAKDKSGVRPAFYTVPASDNRDFLIKSKDNVKIIAYIGNARIEALGEAQQDGRLGEIIRIRNIESNRVVHGRVEAGGLVLVDY
jgi:flagellar basal body P-ring formation protein FlgA